MAEDMELAVQRLRQGYEAFNRGDFDAAAALMHPEIEVGRLAEVEQSVKGREAVREWMRPVVFERQNVDVQEMDVRVSAVIVCAVIRGVGRGSGIEVTLEVFQVWRFRDGLAISLDQFSDRAEAERMVDEDQ